MASAELSGARSRLITALSRGARERVAKQAAEVQLRFDCWMQEQEENFQPDDIAACRSGFLVTIENIETSIPVPIGSNSSLLRVLPVADREVKGVRQPEKVIVKFSFDSPVIDDAAKVKILKAITAYKEFGISIVRVSGHADRAGTEAYNMKLGRARADAVTQVIKHAGIPRIHVRAFSFGESRPEVPTEDGVRESKNRRVEIEINSRHSRTAVHQ